MLISPEIGKLPYICRVFAGAGLVDDLVFDLAKGRRRNLIADAVRLSEEFDKHSPVSISGIENIFADKGSFLVFNHPNVDKLLPALLKLMIDINVEKRKNPVFVMGSEIPLFGRFNKFSLPGSPALLRRFHSIYPDNIISVPTARGRKDYLAGRYLAARKVIKSLESGNIVVISPEGHVEIDNQISPLETFNVGSGKLAIIATGQGIPINPVGIWVEKDIIQVVVGKSFKTEIDGSVKPADKKVVAVGILMERIANLLPERLRGPFRQE